MPDSPSGPTALLPVVIVFVLLLGAFWWGFSVLLDQRVHPNQDLFQREQTPGRAVIHASIDGHYRARGFVNGQPVQFLIDTGATNVAFPGAVAQRLGLRKMARSHAMTAGGVVPAWLTRVGSIRVGGVVVHDVAATIVPAFPGEGALLGMSFLDELTLLQQDNVLILIDPRMQAAQGAQP